MKQKKFYLSIALVLTFSLAANIVAFGNDPGNPPSIDSDSEVSFTDNTDPVGPKDPDGGDGKPNPDKTGSGGPLSIDYVSDFNFGEQKKSTETMTYGLSYAQGWVEGQSEEEKPCFLQFTDSRDELAGFSIKVKQNEEFTHVDDNDKTLKGTEIIFSNINYKNSFDEDPTTWSQAPTTFTVKSDLTETSVITAGTDEGAGTSWMLFGTDTNMRDSVQLMIPAQQTYTGKYTTTLTWTLEDAE